VSNFNSILRSNFIPVLIYRPNYYILIIKYIFSYVRTNKVRGGWRGEGGEGGLGGEMPQTMYAHMNK
jgi:hypothetical protein